MSYTQKVLEELKARYPEQPEFIQEMCIRDRS